MGFDRQPRRDRRQDCFSIKLYFYSDRPSVLKISVNHKLLIYLFGLCQEYVAGVFVVLMFRNMHIIYDLQENHRLHRIENLHSIYQELTVNKFG